MPSPFFIKKEGRQIIKTEASSSTTKATLIVRSVRVSEIQVIKQE